MTATGRAPSRPVLVQANMTCDKLTMDSRFLPVLGIFAGGLVSSLLPRQAFGKYGFAIRAVVTGAVAGTTGHLRQTPV